MRDLTILVVIFGTLLPDPAARAQQPAPAPAPCSGQEHRQFDFWLGTWDVFDSTGTLAGRNTITRELDGCALHERWESARGPHRGNSYSIYDRASGRWHQAWVDNSGLLLLLSGGPRQGTMVLEGRSAGPDGAARLDRITWTPRPDAAVTQVWEQSADGGRTWTVVFNGRHVPGSR
jgi:hypothetical protein